MSVLPDRAARAFPLLLLIFVAGLAWLLDRATSLPSIAPERHSTEPDLIVSRFVATVAGPDGQPLYTLNANTMRHYPRDDHSELEAAKMVRTTAAEAPLTVTASKANVASGGKTILFTQDVVMERAPTPQVAAMTLRTSALTLKTEPGSSCSDAPTEILSDQYHIRTTGFDYDHATSRAKFHSKVNITYAPPKR